MLGAAAHAFSPPGNDLTAQYSTLKAKKSGLTPEEQLIVVTYKKATPGPGAGGVYNTKVFKLSKPLTVYRVYSKQDAATARMGTWWSHTNPAGSSLAAYRKNYAICHAWNTQMDTMVTCTLDAGTILAIGPGEAVDKGKCQDPNEHYLKDTAQKWYQIALFESYKGQGGKIHCGDASKDKANPLKKP